MKKYLVLLLAILALGKTGICSDRYAFSDISKPDFFPILPWDPLHGWYRTNVQTHTLESVADCNFNLAGFVWPKDLKQCEKLGLGAIVLPLDAPFLPGRFHKEWRTLSDEEIDNRIRQIVKYSGKSKAIKGYFIMDEPGARDFVALGKAVAAVKKYAPGKYAYINLFPDYATIGAPDLSQLGTGSYTEYLERFVSEVRPQAISYDNYRVQMSMDLQDSARAASYYRNLLEVRRVALKYNLPYLNIVSANQIRPYTTIPSPANLSFQAYTTLAAGYRGVTWYTYFERGYNYGAIDKAGRKTMTWYYLQEINRQVATLAPVMSRLKSTGVYFTAPAPTDKLPQLPGEFVGSVTSDMPMMVGEFRDSSDVAHVMVVNLSLEKSALFKLETRLPTTKIEVISASDRALSRFDPAKGFWLVAGQGVLLRLE